MKRPLRRLLVTTIVAAIPLRAAVAEPVYENVPVRGGRTAVAAAFNINPVPDRARFVSEAARLIHGFPERTDRNAVARATPRERLERSAASGAPPELVPVPLTAAIWSSAVFLRAVSKDDLVSEILADRQASLLVHGLSALDDQTLEYLAQHPALLTRLYTFAAEPLAAYASTIRVRSGRVVPPGGDGAAVLWEAVVGEPTSRPEQFIPALLTKSEARVAGLYDTIGHLDEPRRQFALGLWIADPSARIDRMQALVAAVVAVPSEGRTIRAQPFARQPHDLTAILSRVRVDAAGRPIEPASRAFWSRVMASADLPGDPVQELADASAGDGASVDAAWLARWTVEGDGRLRAERLDQFAFGQRVFGGVPASQLADALVATRAFRRYRMLMVTLERIGIASPAAYAAAARTATRLSPQDRERAFMATAQFQGALVLLWRMAAVGTLDARSAEALVASLVAVPLNDSSEYAGGIVRWLDEQLRPAIPAAATLDGAIEAALAGADRSMSAPRIEWEGRRYRVDVAAAERQRLRRVREKQRGATLDVATDLAAAAVGLRPGAATPVVVQAAADRVRSVAKERFSATEFDSRSDADFPPGVALPPDPRSRVMTAIEELARTAGGANGSRTARAAAVLVEASDQAAAQALVSLAYAISLGDPEGAALLPGNVSGRHDFGFNQKDADQRLRAAWLPPRQDVSPGVPWHVDGSLLGLDVALARTGLRRLSANGALAAPTLTSNERETFVATLGLLNPRLMTDAGRDAIAEAIALGRRRVALIDDATEAAEITAELDMDGWRARAFQWTAANDRPQLESMLSLRELMAAGHVPAGVDLDPWGTAAIASEGCVCTRMPPPGRLPLLIGRHQIGLFATAVPDVNLHVARMLSDLRLPARLAKYVLSAALLDFVDEVRSTDADDWLSLVRAAAGVTRERIEDYVAAAAADGPLMMESSQ